MYHFNMGVQRRRFGLTRIFTRQYLDITRAISWKRALLMALMPNHSKIRNALTHFIERHGAFYCGF